MSNVDLNERLYSENIYDVEGVPASMVSLRIIELDT